MHAGHGVDTPAKCDRVTTVFRKVGPRFPGSLASRDGSDLLSLRLPLLCSWVARFCRPPQSGGFAKLARFARSPNIAAAFALRFAAGALRRGGLARRLCPRWLTVVTWTPLGHCVSPASRNSRRTSLGSCAVSCFAPRRSVPCSQFLAGATPPRGTGETCLSSLATGRGSTDQLRRPFPGCPGVSQGCLRRFFHSSGHFPVLSKNALSRRRAVCFFKDLFLTTC